MNDSFIVDMWRTITIRDPSLLRHLMWVSTLLAALGATRKLASTCPEDSSLAITRTQTGDGDSDVVTTGCVPTLPAAAVCAALSELSEWVSDEWL